MSKKTILCGILLLSLSNLFAQEKEKHWIGLETDPISTVFGASTLSAVIEPQKVPHWSLFLNIVSADFPNWIVDFLNPKNKGKGFDTKIKIGGGFAVDYFINEEREGFYFGMINLFFNYQIRELNAPTDESNNFLSHNVIPRVGYRWYPSNKSKFYVNPFLGMRYKNALQNPLIFDSGEYLEYEPAGIQPFGTIHIGYHF